ncbi:hypothetical protein [Erythrobacter sp. YT30]|uniref:SctD/MshK family protein n=1 Tax=Erythrobacter sp. YT30 TaxID=1735012 RepID=UPI00076D1AD0|nr:hypothetical protein [Erythrobacter sp. YT30]KWV92079.1 hypothetical protein AUC45_13105 [Erythrobacter sp. YT30]
MNAISPVSEQRVDFAAAADPQDGRNHERMLLRVLLGRSKGAQHSLPPDRRIMVGHSYENDIVLRDKESRGFAIQLTPQGRLALLEVVAGHIMVLGRKLVVGERIMLEPFVPVRFSSFVFAIGGECEERWLEAERIAQQNAIAAPPDHGTLLPNTNMTERIDLRTQPMRDRYGATIGSPKVLSAFATLLLVLAGGTWFGTSVLGGARVSEERVQRDLAEIGFGRLIVEPAHYGEGLAIIGLVPGEDDLLRLKAWTEKEYPDITLGVATLQGAAEAADNLLAAQDVDADVRPDGVNGLVIETEFLPRDRLGDLEERLRRDLPRVASFTFETSADRGEADLAYFFNAPGYGAASFVSGDPSYIVTEDGTRWFSGANLPTGHTIIEIKENAVIVEREGLRDTLRM